MEIFLLFFFWPFFPLVNISSFLTWFTMYRRPPPPGLLADCLFFFLYPLSTTFHPFFSPRSQTAGLPFLLESYKAAFFFRPLSPISFLMGRQKLLSPLTGAGTHISLSLGLKPGEEVISFFFSHSNFFSVPRWGNSFFRPDLQTRLFFDALARQIIPFIFFSPTPLLRCR